MTDVKIDWLAASIMRKLTSTRIFGGDTYEYNAQMAKLCILGEGRF